jgi:EAL domain-containing protein (putative c-di-GMP-specific phosphodiesterase class I)
VQVVGTGVETEQQMAFLREHGCDELQGTFISPPIAPSVLHQMITPD